MNKSMASTLEPDFYKDFHCVAGDCRHNCCVHDWSIVINKKNYKLLRGLKEPKWLSENFGSYVQRNEKSTGDSDYAIIRQGEHGCQFQSPEGLCRIHGELGPEYLCTTCRQYPRIDTYLTTPGYTHLHRERSLTLSCEEVARLLLHKPEPIQFEAGEEPYNPSGFLSEKRHANNIILNQARPILAHYHLIRAIGIALLQNRDYTVEQRLILLVLYLDKLAKAEQEGATDSIPDLTDTFVQAVDEGLFAPLFAAPKPDSAEVLTYYAAAYAFAAGENPPPVVARCDKGIDEVEPAVRAASYRTFVADKAYFLEHLLVMEFFGKVLPFKSDYNIGECAQYLVSIFAIFRFMLGGYLGECTTLTEVEFIDFVAYFGKAVLHSSSSFDCNIALLAKNNMNTLPYMISLIIG